MNWKSAVATISAGCLAAVLGVRRVHAAPPDACKLLSAAQISAVLGIKVGEGKPVSLSNNKLCQWDAPVLVGKAKEGVALALQSPSQASANTATPTGHRIVKTPARQSAKIPVDGFRGDAYYMTMPEVGGIRVPKESSILQIRVYGFPVDQIKTKERILADCVYETLTKWPFPRRMPRMSSKSRLAMLLVVSFIFGLGSLPAAYAAPSPDACSLLTPAQVSAVLGVPAVGKGLGPKACIWVQTGVKPGSPRGRVDLVILTMQGFTQGYSVAKMPNAPTSATHVSGLGDDAYYLRMTSGPPYMELRVKKGSVAFGIRVQHSGTPLTIDEIKAKEKTLAQDVLAKM